MPIFKKSENQLCYNRSLHTMRLKLASSTLIDEQNYETKWSNTFID